MTTNYNNDQPKARTGLLRNTTQEQRTLELLKSRGSSWTTAAIPQQQQTEMFSNLASFAKWRDPEETI